MSKNYRFGLFDSHDQLIDQTNINEDDPDFAMELFIGFGPDEDYYVDDTTGHYVELLEETDEEDEEELI